MNVGKENIAGFVGDADIVLDMEGELEIVAPVVTAEAVIGKDWIVL